MAKYTIGEYNYNTAVAGSVFVKVANILYNDTILFNDTYYLEGKSLNSNRLKEIIRYILQGKGYTASEGLIVSCGKDTADYHFSGNSVITDNSLLMVDIYARSMKTGLWFDKTITYILGNINKELLRMIRTVEQIKYSITYMAQAGVSGSYLHSVVLNYFTHHGYATSEKEGFCHNLGHTVGTKLHDGGIIGPNSNYILKEGDIITIEPGLYYNGVGGVRYEDMYYVGKKGIV